MLLCDHIVRDLPAACISCAREPEQIAMKLQHQIRRKLHVLVPLMDQLQDAAIACDLSFRAVSHPRLLVSPYQDLDRRSWEGNAFEAIRGFRTFDDSDLPQIF